MSSAAAGNRACQRVYFMLRQIMCASCCASERLLSFQQTRVNRSLGERLGYTDIKVSLPVEITTGTTYLDLYVQQILAMQVRLP